MLNHMTKGFGSNNKEYAQYTGRIRPGQLSRTRKVPSHILVPDYALGKKAKPRSSGLPWEFPPTPTEDIAKMRIAGRFAREILDTAVRLVRPGITTDDIDALVHEETIKRNAYPSPLKYGGFPKSCCTSVNEIICHGIPDSTKLIDGDIINIDVTVFHDGVHGDCSETVLVGENVDPQVKDLVHTTFEAWNAAIKFCQPGKRYNEIGGIIEDIIIPKGYASVQGFCGHGINRAFHCYPNVLHYRNNGNYGVMQPGHTFTIEPMICLGTNDHVTWEDDWTVATADGKPSAQFEHTLLVTETGVDILTAKLPSSPNYFWET
jgi:methionyl aminopeptidase